MESSRTKTGDNTSDWYWSATENASNANNAWNYNFNNSNWNNNNNKTNSNNVRACFAYYIDAGSMYELGRAFDMSTK